jgi:hypothetical protein
LLSNKASLYILAEIKERLKRKMNPIRQMNQNPSLYLI